MFYVGLQTWWDDLYTTNLCLHPSQKWYKVWELYPKLNETETPHIGTLVKIYNSLSLVMWETFPSCVLHVLNWPLKLWNLFYSHLYIYIYNFFSFSLQSTKSKVQPKLSYSNMFFLCIWHHDFFFASDYWNARHFCIIWLSRRWNCAHGFLPAWPIFEQTEQRWIGLAPC